MGESHARRTGPALGMIAAVACVVVWLRLARDPLWLSFLAWRDLPGPRLVALATLALFVPAMWTIATRAPRRGSSEQPCRKPATTPSCVT
jgi:hypothetical protein